MVSQEFKLAVANKNLLRTRIMLKDSFVIDPTFVLLKEMLAYAKQTLPDLMVPFDNDTLEEDPTMWNQEVMNMELVQLVNNFSEIRIAHLQKVVSKVMAEEIERMKVQNFQHDSNYQCIRRSSNSLPGYSVNSVITADELRREALQEMMRECKKINKVLQTVKETKKWELSQINELEKVAKQLLQSTQKYKANR